MGKTVDFSGASKRHYLDAELLLTNNRIPNAGHLFGFAAECGIKALLVAHGLQPDPTTGDIMKKGQTKYRVHINLLINNVQTFSNSQPYSQYVGMMPKLMAFSDWDINHRYHDVSSIPPSYIKWREAAREVMKMLDNLILNNTRAKGVIP